MKVVIDKDELIELINKKIKEQDFKIVVEDKEESTELIVQKVE